MSSLIEQINARAHNPQSANDELKGVAAPPVTEKLLNLAEEVLGFTLPDLLRQLYLEVGNGGFGPGFGIFSVAALPNATEEGIVERYQTLRHGDQKKSWPNRLIPICEWGHGITSYLDCLQPQLAVIRVDPNMPKLDVKLRVPTTMWFGSADQIKEACWIECASFETWLQGWVDGQSLFYAAYRRTDEEENDEDDDSEEDE